MVLTLLGESGWLFRSKALVEFPDTQCTEKYDRPPTGHRIHCQCVTPSCPNSSNVKGKGKNKKRQIEDEDDSDLDVDDLDDEEVSLGSMDEEDFGDELEEDGGMFMDLGGEEEEGAGNGGDIT